MVAIVWEPLLRNRRVEPLLGSRYLGIVAFEVSFGIFLLETFACAWAVSGSLVPFSKRGCQVPCPWLEPSRACGSQQRPSTTSLASNHRFSEPGLKWRSMEARFHIFGDSAVYVTFGGACPHFGATCKADCWKNRICKCAKCTMGVLGAS